MGIMEENLSEISSDEAELLDTIQELHVMITDKSENRRLTTALLYQSDFSSENDIATFVPSVTTERSASLEGWLNTVPFVKYVAHKRQKSLRYNEDQAGRVNHSDLSSKHNIPEQEWDYLDIPLWKACVEPVTCRYIPNNGRYRNCKLLKRLQPPKATKGKHVGYDQLTPEKKQLQREIQKELKRELEHYQSEKQRTRLHPSVLGESNSGSDTETPKTKASKGSVQSTPRRVADLNKRPSKTQIESSPHRQKSYILDTPKKQELSTTDSARESNMSIPLPPINIPLVHSIASKETFVEQFTSRLSALEREMQIDMRSLKKSREKGSNENNVKKGAKSHFRSRSEPPVDIYTQGVYEQFVQKVPLTGELFLSARRVKDNRFRSQNKAQNCRTQADNKNTSLKTHFRYTSGDIVGVPKFGTAGAPPASTFYGTIKEGCEKIAKSADNSPRESTAENAEDSLSLEGSISDSLQKIITTLKLSAVSGTKISDSSSASSSRVPKSVHDNMKSVPLGKPNARVKKADELEADLLLPEIAGTKMSVTANQR